MPELPDITVYLEALASRVLQQPLERLRVGNPFLVRTIEPAVTALDGRRVIALRRLGKRIVFAMEGDLFIVLHLMIAGRLRWREHGAAIPGKVGLAAFDFPTGTAILTEQGAKRQASIHVVSGAAALASLDPGGLEVLGSTLPEFAERLTRENHTLKRALTDPHIFSGIGNAYSDEIARLHEATIRTLEHWIARLRDEIGDRFPDKVTAFREGMAAHGRY